MGRTESRSSARHGTGHLVGLATSSALRDAVGRRLHVGELERSLLGEVVESSRDHDLGLAREDRLASNLSRLESGSAGSDGDLDGTAGGEEKQVDPSSDSVDESGRPCQRTRRGGEEEGLTSPGECPSERPSLRDGLGTSGRARSCLPCRIQATIRPRWGAHTCTTRRGR